MKKISLFLSVIIITSLVFTVSCVSKEVPVTETYSETEYKIDKTEGVNDLAPRIKWYANLYGDALTGDPATGKCTGYTPVISYYGYEIGTSQYSKSNIEVFYSFTGNANLSGQQTCLYVHDLTGIGQIVLPTNFEFGKSLQYKTENLKDLKVAIYIPTPEEQKWLESYHSIVGMGDIQASIPAEKALHLLASFSPVQQDMCGVDTKYTPNNGGLTDLGVAALGMVYRYKCSITFDVSKVKEFAIITRTKASYNPALCTGELAHAFRSTIEISNVQLLWTNEIQTPYEVERQRTVMQTKKVPFWEVWSTNQPAETEPSSPSTTEVKPVVETTSPNTTTPATNLVSINDDFSDSNSGWGVSSADWGTFAYEDGEYGISIEKMNWFGYHLNSVSGKQEDFTAEVDVRKLSQGTDDAAGIVFRDQMGQGKDSFYVFWVDCNNGTYDIEKYIQGVWAPSLKDFTSSNYIQRGANTNRLKVMCKGSQIEVYVNDNKLTTVTDTSFSRGFIGLAAETFTSSNAHYHFDNFKLYTSD